jgi:hypothetical protein
MLDGAEAVGDYQGGAIIKQVMQGYLDQFLAFAIER